MRSDQMKKGIKRAPHRSLFHALGITEEELQRPIIGIANSANEIIPGHMHLQQLAAAVKAGIRIQGGTPMEFSTIGICDGIAMDHKGMKFSLPSRELIADSIELVAGATPFDGLVFLTNCDKITPGMLMAMGRLNIPSILVSGGPMLAGIHKGKAVDLVSVFEAVGRYQSGRIDGDELKQMEILACPGAGSCSGLFTANSMNALSEALGVALQGNGTIPAVFSERIKLSKYSGMKAVSLVLENRKPRDIVTGDSFYNAVAVDLALGGSTNTTLHLPAIAGCFDIEFDINIFDRLSRKVPHLCDLSPVGSHHIEDLHEAGGIYAVMNRLREKGLVRETANTVYQKPIGELIERTRVTRDEVIRPLDNPYHLEGGLAILYGNLAPRGSVTKTAGIPEKMKYHKGPALVFEDGETAARDILAGKAKKGDIVVIRYEGPKGGPGMREMLSPTSAIVGMGLVEDVALITDGRFSGGSIGSVIGHVSPEAAEKGAIAAVRDGDLIEIDVPNRQINLLLSPEEIEQRLLLIKPHRPKVSEGVLKRYSHFVQSADTGATYKDLE
ncbi:MAG: dihydroxy-acid dehydratase [Candidatus Aminicenantes bacterium]|nr:dihydroxy-acid dehydratase [Candidatus Aminicenantes bacterium]